ncbi:hypothetical protein V1503_24180 [Bacillus sp. SCS-151]|uniref:hypothetical protein n=1 Tax=Nanhaiella sioensis TaxID=3115293 RepID=UPI00397A0625
MNIQKVKLVQCDCRGELQFCLVCGGTGRLMVHQRPLTQEEVDRIVYISANQIVPYINETDEHLLQSNLIQEQTDELVSIDKNQLATSIYYDKKEKKIYPIEQTNRNNERKVTLTR